MNNKARGRVTPDSLTFLGTGTYNITFKKNLFRDTTFSVQVTDGKRTNAIVDYNHNLAMLALISCSSNPSNAEIFLNGFSTGHFTPYVLRNILPGNYYIKYHKTHFRDDSTLVSVRSSSYSSVFQFLVDTTLWQDYTTSNSGILSNDLTCLTINKNNIVYAGSRANGFMSFDGVSWKSIYNSLSFQINCSALDNNNMVFFGTPRGFVTYGAALTTYGFMSSGLQDFRIQTIATDNEKNWYIGTQGGIMEVYQPNGPATNWISYPDQDAGSKYIVASAVEIMIMSGPECLTAGLQQKRQQQVTGSTILFQTQAYRATI